MSLETSQRDDKMRCGITVRLRLDIPRELLETLCEFIRFLVQGVLAITNQVE